MRALWAVLAGLALGAGLAWWQSRDTPEQQQSKARRAQQAAAENARDARPSLYRWRDDDGVLQITEQPPKHRKFERIDRDAPTTIRVNGAQAD